MPRLNGTTDAQSKFLRACIKCKNGPEAKDWPSAAILRRWMRRPKFVAALRSLQGAMRAQSDFQLTSSATASSGTLQTLLTLGKRSESFHKEVMAMVGVLRLTHIHDRLPGPEAFPAPPLTESSVVRSLRTFSPAMTVGRALEIMDGMIQRRIASNKPQHKLPHIIPPLNPDS